MKITGLDGNEAAAGVFNDSEVIKVITNNPSITQSGIGSELGWPLSRVKYYTKKLRDKDVLDHKGNTQ
ncbi:MAG TPA: winged helix-turn-helix domain-containing protein [Desulfosporosinus sp.]|nr:winged helix-turn-helix domain-containing protein [Desulfosporosinus sp.]